MAVLGGPGPVLGSDQPLATDVDVGAVQVDAVLEPVDHRHPGQEGLEELVDAVDGQLRGDGLLDARGVMAVPGVDEGLLRHPALHERSPVIGCPGPHLVVGVGGVEGGRHPLEPGPVGDDQVTVRRPVAGLEGAGGDDGAVHQLAPEVMDDDHMPDQVRHRPLRAGANGEVEGAGGDVGERPAGVAQSGDVGARLHPSTVSGAAPCPLTRRRASSG